ncbi:trypsin delta-like [Eupeodes corollae]|uniref:trypsin delta-like n=1 Tax=Eupeodes corollae TaxID=290404 RepID=UPI002491A301|nr:trypsin delta-like [Eupeodes corollae]
MFRLIVALSVLSLAWGLEDRIVNGKVASIMQYPFQVSLQKYNSHYCGGSVLTENWILTAAHCLRDIIAQNQIDILTIRAGSSNWLHSGVVKKAEFVSMHPLYEQHSMIYDVGLVKIMGSLVFGNKIKPIALPAVLPALYEPVVVTAWGQLSETDGNLASVLQAATLEFLTNDKCASPQYGYGRSIMKSMICADGPSKDSCQGDSGGPLSIPRTNIQIGVVSWGLGCAKRGFPGIYCDLTDPEVVSYLMSTVPNLKK